MERIYTVSILGEIVKVKITDEGDEIFDIDKNDGCCFFDEGCTIYIDSRRIEKPKLLKDIIAHEVTHAIQHITGLHGLNHAIGEVDQIEFVAQFVGKHFEKIEKTVNLILDYINTKEMN